MHYLLPLNLYSFLRKTMASVTFLFCTVLIKVLPTIAKGFNLSLCLTLKIKLKTIQAFHKTTNASSKEFDNFEI